MHTESDICAYLCMLPGRQGFAAVEGQSHYGQQASLLYLHAELLRSVATTALPCCTILAHIYQSGGPAASYSEAAGATAAAFPAAEANACSEAVGLCPVAAVHEQAGHQGDAAAQQGAAAPHLRAVAAFVRAVAAHVRIVAAPVRAVAARLRAAAAHVRAAAHMRTVAVPLVDAPRVVAPQQAPQAVVVPHSVLCHGVGLSQEAVLAFVARVPWNVAVAALHA